MKFVKEYAVDEFVNESTRGKGEKGATYWTAKVLKGNEEFYGVSSAEQCRKLGALGWPEGRELIEKIKVLIDGKLGNQTRQYSPVYDVSGSYVDVGRYCEGVPECMLTFEETDSPQTGFVWVHVSVGVNSMVSTSEIQLQGAATAALVDALESAGHRVKLTWERSSQSCEHNSFVTLWMTLKEYDEPLDLDRLAFFLTHNAPRRVMAFQEYLKRPELAKALDVEAGAAHCHPWQNREPFKGADIKLGHVQLYDEAEAAEWVLGQIKEREPAQ